MPARFVIHTVGPVWRGGREGEAALLASCYRSSLELAAQSGITSIAFPAISCGVYGFPADGAARIAVDTVTQGLEQHANIERVVLIGFDRAISDMLQGALSDSRASRGSSA